jgi:hypothetical protein
MFQLQGERVGVWQLVLCVDSCFLSTLADGPLHRFCTSSEPWAGLLPSLRVIQDDTVPDGRSVQAAAADFGHAAL